MTLILPPDTEGRLRTVAGLRGQPPQEALNTLLDQALTEAEAETEMIRAELQASVDDFAAGRSMSIEELRDRLQARRQARSASKLMPESAAHS
ncbi:MAG: hypothetical protein M3Y28_10220 [Armatimonadota bacterium]|nr:hypothetical protein [Armatimonadota bacterium]